jgi:alpha-L-fucosidase 2
MVFGGVERERLQLNEDTLWAGGPYDPVNPEAREALPEVRRLVFEGKYSEASRLIRARVMSKPLGQMPYETAGDLILTFPDTATVENYRRDLNLDTAVSGVEYSEGGVRFRRQVFASPVDQVIVVRLTADRKHAVSFTAGLQTPQKASVDTESGNTLVMRGTNGSAQGVQGSLKFQVRVRVVVEEGTTKATADKVEVTNADSATVLIAMATSYRGFQDVSGDPEAIVKAQIKAAAGKRCEKLLDAHVREHQRLFRRVSFDLGAKEASRLPTDERIVNFHNGNDPEFAALYFQFGRYLLLGCSRPGGQPANLQGLWNQSMNPPWQSKYTIIGRRSRAIWATAWNRLWPWCGTFRRRARGQRRRCMEPAGGWRITIRICGGRPVPSMGRIGGCGRWGERGCACHYGSIICSTTTSGI